MGRLVAGIYGPVHGKVGTIVGSSRNGVPYIKGLYKNRTAVVSKKELLNRKKFAVAQAWLKPLLEFVRQGFRGHSQRSEGFVAAKSWLLKNAMVINGDEIRVEPALVKVSSGDLPNPKNLTVSLTETGDLTFSWDPSSGNTDDHDQIMMLAYNVEKPKPVFNTTGQFRSVGTDTLVMGDAKGIYHVYAAFSAADRSRQSDSVYLGEWKIQ